MKYRKMGLMGWETSVLGFGAMRLPTVMKEGISVVDEEEAIRMIRYGIDQGINYIDTAWMYHDHHSEEIVGRALQDGYRERIHLISKFPIWQIDNIEDVGNYLPKQLEKLQSEYLDIYLLHGLNRATFQKVKDWKMIEQMEKWKSEGKIKHFGFSFHDDFDAFKEIIDFYNWEVCQIQFNYVDRDTQATLQGLEYAASKNMAVIIMEPIKGGQLVKESSEITEILAEMSNPRSLADLALQYVWNNPGVSCVLSGMSSMDQVKENIESANKSGPNSLLPDELAIIEKLRPRFKTKSLIPCTFCKYCLPCPNGVFIPKNFKILNDYFWDGNQEEAYMQYTQLANSSEKLQMNPDNGNASMCIDCGQCLPHCPQNINIPSELKKIDQVFENEKNIAEVFYLSIRGPQIVDKPAYIMVGFEYTGRQQEDIMERWKKFNGLETQIKNARTDHSFNVAFLTDSPETERHLLCDEVEKLEDFPNEMHSEIIPAQKWAIFTHIGPMANAEQSYDYIFQQWLLEHPLYQLAELKINFEYYDGRFRVNSPDGELDIYIPIVLK